MQKSFDSSLALLTFGIPAAILVTVSTVIAVTGWVLLPIALGILLFWWFIKEGSSKGEPHQEAVYITDWRGNSAVRYGNVFLPFRQNLYTIKPHSPLHRVTTQTRQVGLSKLKLTIKWRPNPEQLDRFMQGAEQHKADYFIAQYADDLMNEYGLDWLCPKKVEKWDAIREESCGVTITYRSAERTEPLPVEEEWMNYDDLLIGVQDDAPVFLDDEDQVAHIQIIGASRFGKSKLIEYAMRQKIFDEIEGVCVIDPNQQLYDDLLTWCVHNGDMGDTLHFLDPSDERSLIGFNPFRLEGKRTPDRISARANRLQATTLKVLGTQGDAIQAQRIIKCLYYVLIEQNLPVTELNAFMVPRLFDRRDEIMAACQSQDIRDQWDMLTMGKGTAAYINMMQSSANRLFDIIAERGVQRIFTNPQPINLREITAEGHTLLVNLGKSDIFPLAARNVIGAFLVDEVWDIVSSRTREQAGKLPRFNFVIDEFHNFATPEFATMLKEGAKYGLHLWLINHALDDLDRTVRGSLNACHTRIAFGKTAQKDAAAVMEGSRPAQGNDLRDEISWIPGLNKRVFMLSRTGKRNVLCTTPLVKDFPVTPADKDGYLEWHTRNLVRVVFPGLTPGTPEFREAVTRHMAETQVMRKQYDRETEQIRLRKEAEPITGGEPKVVLQNDPQKTVKPSPPKPSPAPKQPTAVEPDDFYH